MQIKIIIGTVAFMLTMILLGFYSLLEPARMSNFTDARLGRQIEKGAEIFANNCASCHGENGLGTNGGNCGLESDGSPKACVGRQLNGRSLLCGDKSQRMEERAWSGNKFGFVHDTVNSGRAGGVMVPWGQAYGGPLQPNSVDNVTHFVLNWETQEMCDFVPVVFPWPDPIEMANEAWALMPAVTEDDVRVANPDLDAAEPVPFELPLTVPGDAVRGEDLYLNTYSCNACHGNPSEPGSDVNAPWHGDLAINAPNRVDGLDATGYIYQSILAPDAFYVDGYGALMQSYSESMGQSPQDLIDIVTYLLEQDG